MPIQKYFSGLDMDHECLRTDGLSPRYQSSMDILPNYGSMMLSPANLWARDSAAFQMDPNLVATVFNYQRSYEGIIILQWDTLCNVC